jgi:hypothetical protein
MSASMLFKDKIGSCRPGFNPQYQQNFSVGIFQDLSTLTDFNWIVSMVKSDLMDADSSCGSKSNCALVHLCTCKVAAKRSKVYVRGKNNKYKNILPIPETMQGSQRKKGAKKNIWVIFYSSPNLLVHHQILMMHHQIL